MKQNLMYMINRNKVIRVILMLVILLLIPLLKPSNYIITVLVQCMVFASLGESWNIIGGYGGQVGWCQASFVAIGAYTSVILYSNFRISPLLTIPLGVLLSVILATIIGVISFRFKGPFFAITTIAFAESIRVLLNYFKSITKGSAGIAVPYHGASPLNLVFDSDVPFYYIMIFILFVVVFVTWIFINSKHGYYLQTIKGDEDAARSLGINSSKVKLRAFQLSAALAALVGVFYAFFQTFIAPEAIAGLDFTIKIVSCVIIGGIGTLYGPIVGAFITIPLIEIANTIMTAGSQMLYGIALVVIVIVQPSGIVGIYEAVKNRIAKKNKGERRI